MKDCTAVISILFLAWFTSLFFVILDTEDEKAVMYEDFEALQEAYDELHEEHEVTKDGYRELQEDYSQKTEQIEYLEYRIMSDVSISPELKQEIKENVPREVE